MRARCEARRLGSGAGWSAGSRSVRSRPPQSTVRGGEVVRRGSERCRSEQACAARARGPRGGGVCVCVASAVSPGGAAGWAAKTAWGALGEQPPAAQPRNTRAACAAASRRATRDWTAGSRAAAASFPAAARMHTQTHTHNVRQERGGQAGRRAGGQASRSRRVWLRGRAWVWNWTRSGRRRTALAAGGIPDQLISRRQGRSTTSALSSAWNFWTRMASKEGGGRWDRVPSAARPPGLDAWPQQRSCCRHRHLGCCRPGCRRPRATLACSG